MLSHLAALVFSAVAAGAVTPLRLVQSPSLRMRGRPRHDHKRINEFELGQLWKSNFTKREQGLLAEGSCDVSKHVNRASSFDSWCPAECPYAAEDINSGGFCDFRCVDSWRGCMALNPNATVADDLTGSCMPCRISGCAQCASDGSDTCEKCGKGYYLASGICRTQFFAIWMIVGIVVLIVFSCLCVWIVDLMCRKEANPAGILHGLHNRSRMKLHHLLKVNSANGGQATCTNEYWPITTNLLTTEVGGPGVTLHFRFQVAVIMWASLIALAWAILAMCVDTNLFVIGTREAHTPRMYCIVVDWGWQLTGKLWPYLFSFDVFVYMITTVGSLMFSIQQLRKFQELTDTTPLNHRFVAMCRNLPLCDGKEKVEEQLKTHMEEVTGKNNVIGCSVAWEMGAHEQFLMDVVKKDMEEEEKEEARSSVASSIKPTGLDHLTISLHGLRSFTNRFEQKLLGYSEDADSIDSSGAGSARSVSSASSSTQAIVGVLESLQTSGHAFVVFETQADRDEAVEIVKNNGGLHFKGSLHTQDANGKMCNPYLHKVESEPDTVMWENLVRRTGFTRVVHGILGAFVLFLALTVWTVCFFVPYAYFVLAADHKHWTEPSILKLTSMSMLVVIGNQVMYMVCEGITRSLRFKFTDRFEAAHAVLYTIAVTFNVIIDLVVTYQMALHMLADRGVKLHDGTPLTEVSTFRSFKAYALQKELGNQLWAYNFPATFLTPFIIEPFAVIIVPLFIMVLLVRSHPEVDCFLAEECLACSAMDMSRYGDIVVNIILASLVFFCTSGFWLKMFVALALSHMYIYVYDQWRLLRAVPKIDVSSMVVDKCAQLLLAIPCGLMLVCIIFQSYHVDYEEHGHQPWIECLSAFLCHVVIHCLLIIYVVPAFGRRTRITSSGAKEDENLETNIQKEYKDFAATEACSFFTANPVWCLRSKYKYDHKPKPCSYFVPGKEHRITKSPEAHCYFHVDKGQISVENFDRDHLINELSPRSIGNELNGILSHYGLHHFGRRE